MPTMTALAMPHRTVLNVLNNSSGTRPSVAGRGASENMLMGYPGVDRDVIYELVDGEYLTGPHRWAVTYGLEPRTPDYDKHIQCCVAEYRKHGDKFFDFHITDRGKTWVGGDPLSVLVGSVWMAPSHRMRLHEVLGFSDRDVIRKAIAGGYLTLQYVDGHETELRGNGDYEFRHARDFHLAATSKARNVLG